MDIQNLINRETSSCSYTSNAYLITGNWNAIEDVNTLVDVGRDPNIISAIENASTGLGKKRIAQVILTHEHYDHVDMLEEIRKRYSPIVYGYSKYIPGIDRVLRNWDTLRCGDREFKVIWAPGHSSESIFLYCQQEGVIFTGDNPIKIDPNEKGYTKEFIEAMIYVSRLNIRSVYPGHGPATILNPR